MAITRLTDIITVFDSKWTYGDVKFGYDGEVNQDHDTQYPLMLVNPPESIMPVVYDGREEYSFEINFYNLYSQAAQSVVTLQKRWDNLQDLSNEWLDMVLKNYQDVTVEAYINDESIEIERIKDTQNDKLVQIKLVFTMSAFTKCFRPVSNYPSDFANLAVWLRADSGVKFDIPTKRVSAWSDSSGKGNNMTQSTALKQPLRYGYGGQNDKAYFSFDGTDDYITSDNNLAISGTPNEQFSIFEVSKINKVSGTAFNYFSLLSEDKVLNGDFSNGETNWVFGTNWSVVGEEAVVVGLGNNEDIYQSMGMISGRLYEITLDVSNFSIGTGQCYVTNSGYSDFLTITNNGSYTYSYIATNSTLSIRRKSDATFHIDNVSVKEVEEASIEMGTNVAGNYEVSVSDGTTVLLEKTTTVDTGGYHIGVLRKESDTINLNYYDSSSSVVGADTDAAFITTTSFKNEKFRIGSTQISDGLTPPSEINTRYLDGEVQELIIYDRKLSDNEVSKVVGYLNLKYKIY
jgi:hypothetical protein